MESFLLVLCVPLHETVFAMCVRVHVHACVCMWSEHQESASSAAETITHTHAHVVVGIHLKAQHYFENLLMQSIVL